MHLPACLLLVLVLAIAPHPGTAQGPAGYGLTTPVLPPIHGFAALFQSPPPRIVAEPTGAVALGAAAAAVVRPPALSSNPSGTIGAGAICRPALIGAEARVGIPTGLLQAIGLVESGRRDEITGRREPWPWTINAEGEGRYFDTKEQAVAWVRQAQARGMRSIDVGCAQVNLMHHPAAFVSLEQAFDPAANAEYAARFLKQLWGTTAGGNWMTAAGHYHSQTPELADPYRQQVQSAMASGSLPMPPTPALASPLAPMSPFAPAGPLQSPGVARSEPGRLMPAPAGTVGRGLDAYRATPIQMTVATRPNATGPDRGAAMGVAATPIGRIR